MAGTRQNPSIGRRITATAMKGSMKELEILREEHDRLGSVIIAHYSALDRVLGLALVVLGGAALFADNPLSLVFVPMGLGLVGLYALDILHEITMASGYKRWVELRINHEIGSPFLLWESWISEPIAQRGRGKRFLFLLYFVVIVTASIVSLFSAVRYTGEYAVLVQSGSICFWSIFWIGAGIAAAEGFGAADLVYAWANKAELNEHGLLPDASSAFRSWRKDSCRVGIFVKSDARSGLGDGP